MRFKITGVADEQVSIDIVASPRDIMHLVKQLYINKEIDPATYNDLRRQFDIAVGSDNLCGVEIPGIGACTERKGEHQYDEFTRPIHKRGACAWNGGAVVEVDGV